MGLLASGQAMLARVMTAEGQSITIKRGQTTVSLVAMPDDPQEGEIGIDGAIMRLSLRRFAVNVSDLGALHSPQDGDQITWAGEAFQVLPMKAGGRCFEYLDNRKSRIGIYGKLFPVSVSYFVGEFGTELNGVTKGSTTFEFTNHKGLTEKVETTDFLIGAEELGIEPVSGHRISEQIGSEVFEYDVTSVNNHPCWRWWEVTGQNQRRIHTKLSRTTVT